jgi:hypothetical protein
MAAVGTLVIHDRGAADARENSAYNATVSMQVFLLTLGIVAALMGGMAVGVILSNKPLRGSCGGVGASCACEEAGKPGACKVEVGSDATGSALRSAASDAAFKPPGELMRLRKG